MKFRPCIDLHNGRVVQIVGGTLSDTDAASLQTNFVAADSPATYASLYRADGLAGGHVVSLGAGNRAAAFEALATFPGGMQYGGGVNPGNAGEFLDAGASHVIVTSWVFNGDRLDMNRLAALSQVVGRDKLVLDLSCRMRDKEFHVVTNRWQTFTAEKMDAALLEKLAQHCCEYLVHGVDVEGKRQGIQEDLIVMLGELSPLPVTYAGGVSRFSDLDLVNTLGQGRVDLTIGSALDIFGGRIAYDDVVTWTKAHDE